MKVKFRLRPIQNFFHGALLLLGLVVTGLVSAVLTMQFAIHGHEVKVPALKEMTVAEARSQTAGLGLDLEVDNRYYSADVAAGHILSQSPSPGSVVRRQWRVRVAESLGPQKVEVPSVIGTQERSAALNLRRAGLEAGAIAQLPWSRSESGTVLAQDPPAKAQGIEKPSINLLVAAVDDTPADGFVMPDLTGLPIITAQSLLTRVGIKFGDPKYQDVPIPAVSASGYTPVSAPLANPTSSGQANPRQANLGQANSGQANSGQANSGQANSGQANSGQANSAPNWPTTAAHPVPPAQAGPKPTALPGSVIGQSPPAGYRVEVGSTVGLTVAK